MSPGTDQTRDEDGFLDRRTEVTRAAAFVEAALALAITRMLIWIDRILTAVDKLIADLKPGPAIAARVLLIARLANSHARQSPNPS